MSEGTLLGTLVLIIILYTIVVQLLQPSQTPSKRVKERQHTLRSRDRFDA